MTVSSCWRDVPFSNGTRRETIGRPNRLLGRMGRPLRVLEARWVSRQTDARYHPRCVPTGSALGPIMRFVSGIWYADRALVEAIRRSGGRLSSVTTQ